MTLNDALILSYIKRGIGYGYSILTHVKESRSDEWVEFSRAGLYKILDKLEKEGYIAKKMEQSGGRPPKKLYSIAEGESITYALCLASYAFSLVIIKTLFCPPNPKDSLIAVLTSVFRGSFGT